MERLALKKKRNARPQFPSSNKKQQTWGREERAFHKKSGVPKDAIEHNINSESDLIRLNRFIANAGICSRREADDFIKAGVITVNGQVIKEVGTKIKLTDKVLFHNQPLKREKKIYVLLNKPKNTITTTDDPQGRNTVMDIIKDAFPQKVYPVGRLDRNTTGVLLLTNDGDLAQKLLHPKFQKKKIYDVTLNEPFSPENEKKLRNGVRIDNETIIPDSLSVDNTRQHIGIEIHSGQNRIVRRIFEKLGCRITKLDRVCFAGLTKKGLPKGSFRTLSQKEVNLLQMGAFE